MLLDRINNLDLQLKTESYLNTDNAQSIPRGIELAGSALRFPSELISEVGKRFVVGSVLVENLWDALWSADQTIAARRPTPMPQPNA